MIRLQQALWSGRFEGGMDGSTLEFTSSLDVDSRLAFYDVMGSLAHAKMLKACGIIPAEDADSIIAGLKEILGEIDGGTFKLDYSLEDIHTNVEFSLTQRIGPAGGRLHTGRSRNDQHAQPVSLAQHMLAHAFRFSRDADRFLDAFRRMDKCPLGAAALAGTTYPIDRKMTASALGFREPTENSMDTVSDRDFVSELAYCAAQTAVHLSSLSEELVLWNSQEFGFVEMDDRYATGSSIMPQKKNPDIAELVRGKTGSVIGSLVSMLVLTKGLPLTYNRDLQEDKAPVMESMAAVISSAAMMAKVVSTSVFRTERMAEVTGRGQINATDLADYLVTKGVPFREAHGIVGAAVRKSIETGVNLEDMPLEELRGFSDKIGEDVYQVLPAKRCMERRCSYGGTSPGSTDFQIGQAMEQIMSRDGTIRQEKQLIENCWKALRE